MPAKLIDGQDAFTPEATQVFTAIFTHFDKDNDGVLSDSELDAFAIATNASPFDDASKQEIRDFFDVDSSKQLTKRGFLEMFLVQTLADEDETWKDLIKLGYNKDLKPF